MKLAYIIRKTLYSKFYSLNEKTVYLGLGTAYIFIGL